MKAPLKKVPYYVHTQTNNKSFLLTYLELKELGIKNNRFFLKIYDKSLIGVDPLADDLDEVTMGKILQEVVKNPWYFIREIVRLNIPGGMTRFRLHRGNLALLYLMMSNIDIIIELPRQNYKTMSAICFYVYQYDYGTTNSTFLFGNKSLEDSKLNVKRFKNTRMLVPEWLRLDNETDVDNLTEKGNPDNNNNVILAASTAISPEQADKLGRGNTSPNQWWD